MQRKQRMPQQSFSNIPCNARNEKTEATINGESSQNKSEKSKKPASKLSKSAETVKKHCLKANITTNIRVHDKLATYLVLGATNAQEAGDEENPKPWPKMAATAAYSPVRDYVRSSSACGLEVRPLQPRAFSSASILNPQAEEEAKR